VVKKYIWFFSLITKTMWCIVAVMLFFIYKALSLHFGYSKTQTKPKQKQVVSFGAIISCECITCHEYIEPYQRYIIHDDDRRTCYSCYYKDIVFPNYIKVYAMLGRMLPLFDHLNEIRNIFISLYIKLPRNEELKNRMAGGYYYDKYNKILQQFPNLHVPHNVISVVWGWSISTPSNQIYKFSVNTVNFTIGYSISVNNGIVRNMAIKSRSLVDSLTYVDNRMTTIRGFVRNGIEPDNWKHDYLGSCKEIL
jgi:hypothetical protein